jgi:hypothetical protein
LLSEAIGQLAPQFIALLDGQLALQKQNLVPLYLCLDVFVPSCWLPIKFDERQTVLIQGPNAAFIADREISN